MKAIIAKMRADWPVVAEERIRLGDWTDEDEKEIGAAIADVIAKQDDNLIALWARWLADLSSIILATRTAAIVRKMRAQAAKQHQGQV